MMDLSESNGDSFNIQYNPLPYISDTEDELKFAFQKAARKRRLIERRNGKQLDFTNIAIILKPISPKFLNDLVKSDSLPPIAIKPPIDKLFNVEVEQIEQKIDCDHKNLSNIKIDDDQAESKQAEVQCGVKEEKKRKIKVFKKKNERKKKERRKIVQPLVLEEEKEDTKNEEITVEPYEVMERIDENENEGKNEQQKTVPTQNFTESKNIRKKRKVEDFNKFVIKKINLRDNNSERRKSHRRSNKSMSTILKESLSFCNNGEINKQIIDNFKNSSDEFSQNFKMNDDFKTFVNKKFSSDPMVFISINKFVNKVQPITNLNMNSSPLPPKIPQTFKVKKGNFNLEQLNERLKHKTVSSRDE